MTEYEMRIAHDCLLTALSAGDDSLFLDLDDNMYE